LPEAERAAYERYQDDLHYQASMVESSYTVGAIDGKKEGLEQGIEQGLEQGLEQGKQEEKQEIARKMLKSIDVKTISSMTGLIEAEILALKE
ncbi:MAG: hypothetical protein U9R29_05035, partial [Thermodesulfobacteriota bacterium]|nr:hypothetical protein [Thermodesulfobacteriota bacterium]